MQINKLYNLDTLDKKLDAAEFLAGNVFDIAEKKQFDVLDEVFEQLQYDLMSSHILVAFARYCGRFKKQLKNYDYFLLNAKSALIKLDKNPNKLLRGL